MFLAKMCCLTFNNRVIAVTTTITIPSHLNSGNVLEFNQKLQSYCEFENYCFDFSGLKFAKPYAMLYLSEAIREFVKKNESEKKCGVLIDGKILNSACSYLAHMGFFTDTGIEYGNQAGQAPGGSNYIPITKIIFNDLHEEDKFSCEHELIDKKAKELAQVLVQSDSNDAYEVLGYCIRETLRNAMEHSGSSEVRICGQYWHKNKRAEIAILDNGKGVLQSLKENSLHSFLEDDASALEYAMQPAISGKLIPTRPNSDWSNSGFGLYMLRRICKDTGFLRITTNSASLKINKTHNYLGNFGLKGMSLQVGINLNELQKFGNLEERLERYRNESNVTTEPSSSSMSFMTKVR
jgi:hypothetical protein